MKRGERFFRWLSKAISHYFTFFLLAAFVITCCTMLFVSILEKELGIALTAENITLAAKMTFWNVVLISLVFTVFDGIRRHLTIVLPAKKIAEAAEKMIKGDFTVRVPTISRFAVDDYFNQTIRCINQIAKELSGVETLRTDFIANVSHEMKTPLSVIQNYGTLLTAPGLTEKKRQEYVQGILTASRRLSDMMTNILKLNRLENQEIFPKAEAYNLGEQLCACLLQYENVWEAKDIEIVTEIEEDVLITADEELLALVWNNLLSNAFKFTDAGGKVSLSLSADQETATVRIEDTGCGISPDMGNHIFEKFYQGDTSHATQGNGLGLALVKRVVDIMQGEIRVESRVECGSVFTVTMPRSNHENTKDL